MKRFLRAGRRIGCSRRRRSRNIPTSRSASSCRSRAGSATDIISRILGSSVSAAVGQPVVVDNKAGADGAIAGAEVVKAAPDGYTLLMATNSPMSVGAGDEEGAALRPGGGLHADHRHRPLHVLRRRASRPCRRRRCAELIQYAKANPGKINYATGNTTGIVSTALLVLAGQDRHGARALQGRAAGDDRPDQRPRAVACSRRRRTSVPQMKDGKLRALVTTLPRAQPPAAGRADHRRGRHTRVLASSPGPGCSVRRRCPREMVDAPEQGIRRRDGAARRAGGDGEAGLRADARRRPRSSAAYVKEQLESYRNILQAVGIQPE